MSMKTCPNCQVRAALATRKCKTEGCGWNYSLKMLDPDGSIAAANPRKRTAADMLAGTVYVPTGSMATSANAAAASVAAASARRAAAVRPEPSVATRVGNVTSHSNITADDDGNMDHCIICGDIGMLLCCDVCPRSYHADCAGLEKIPQGFWSCPQCTAKSVAAIAAAAAAASPDGATGFSSSPTLGVPGAARVGSAAVSLSPGVALGLGLQGGLDPFHQRLNACLDFSHVECYEIDGVPMQCFPAPNLALMEQGKAASHAKDRATATSGSAVASRAAQASSDAVTTPLSSLAPPAAATAPASSATV